MSDISAAGGNLEGRRSSAEDPPPDHENVSKYLVPSEKILARNLEHIRVWLQGQPHGIQSRSPHSIITGRSSFQVKHNDAQTVIFHDSATPEEIVNAIHLIWNRNFSRHIVLEDFHNPKWMFRRRIQTRCDKFDMYDFDKAAEVDKVACVPIVNSNNLSFVVRPTSLPNNHSKKSL